MDKEKKSYPIPSFEKSSDLAPVIDTAPWKVLITDDENSMHEITKKALAEFTFMGKNLIFLQAYSAKEARQIIKENPDTTLVLLDIVLETRNAGLELIHHIRKTLNNSITQIVVRTGKPDHAPEQNIIETYEINDYRLKTELTVQRLYTITTTSLRTFHIKSTLLRELNEKRKVEHSLRESEQRFRDIAHTIGDLIWEIDNQGRYTYISKSTKKITKDLLGNLLGTSFTSHMDESESNGNPVKNINMAISSSIPFTNVEIWKKTEQGELACFITSGKPIKDKNGVVTGYRGVDKDITALKNAEKAKEHLMLQLRQTQRIESLGLLAGGIAHDFNNILGAILGYTQLLGLEVKENQKAVGYTEKILASCDRAKKLIFQILDFSRQNRQALKKSAISPSAVTKEALNLLRAALPSSVEIRTSISENIGAILMDPGQLRQIITNLCTNSFQAMENQMGTITITIREVQIHPDIFIPAPDFDLAFGEYVEISIKDNGKGMEDDTVEKIFDPYFSTKRGGDGTGLGLSVVRGIVTNCSGYILTKSCPGKGTEQTIYFPVHVKDKKIRPTDNLFIGQGHGRVLFVDDEEMLVELGKSMLEKLGYEATALNSPTEALEMVAKNPYAFDVVITDLTMPDLQGTELANKIKKLRPDLPVILITGLSSIIAAKEVSARGIDLILSKPLSMTSLAQAMATLVKKLL